METSNICIGALRGVCKYDIRHTEMLEHHSTESGSTGSMCFLSSRIRILLSSCKNNKKNLESYYFVTLFDFLSLKNNVNVPSKSNKQKKLCEKISFLLAS
jgi:hypothetical protein